MWISPQALRVPAVLLGAASSIVSSAQSPKITLAQMNAALQAGEADRALALAHSLPEGGTKDAEAQNLECRVRYTLQQWDAAASNCGQAVELDRENSNYHMWLGRTLGEKADRAPFFSAYSLGKQVRVEFEKAVQLDPHNSAALSDLGSYYKDAPRMMGGGLDKAEEVAERLDKLEPARAHQLRAEIAEGRKDFATAEKDFKEAIATSAHPASQWTVLGSFYERRQRWPEMEWAIRSSAAAASRDKTAGVALYDGAGVLIRAKRDPELAAKMLEDYLAGESKSEEAPAFVAHIRLARLKQQLGDLTGAERERAAAYALAHEYKPAQDRN